jgi:hypothetical protein
MWFGRSHRDKQNIRTTEYLALMLKRIEKPSKHGILGFFLKSVNLTIFSPFFLEKNTNFLYHKFDLNYFISYLYFLIKK